MTTVRLTEVRNCVTGDVQARCPARIHQCRAAAGKRSDSGLGLLADHSFRHWVYASETNCQPRQFDATDYERRCGMAPADPAARIASRARPCSGGRAAGLQPSWTPMPVTCTFIRYWYLFRRVSAGQPDHLGVRGGIDPIPPRCPMSYSAEIDLQQTDRPYGL
jgi:hypothetical protein